MLGTLGPSLISLGLLVPPSLAQAALVLQDVKEAACSSARMFSRPHPQTTSPIFSLAQSSELSVPESPLRSLWSGVPGVTVSQAPPTFSY